MNDVFKALADPSRRLILEELAERKSQTFYELCARLLMRHRVAISRQAIAKHIAVLEGAGLVKSEFHGRYKRLAFSDEPLRQIRENWINKVIEGKR